MADAQEVAFAERIMEFFIEIAAELEEICGCDTDKLIDSLINKPEKSASFVKVGSVYRRYRMAPLTQIMNEK